jgi:hypothetical protein
MLISRKFQVDGQDRCYFPNGAQGGLGTYGVYTAIRRDP